MTRRARVGRVPRWVWIAIAAPGLLGPLAILAFIFRAELAHDEDRCPYRLVERRSLRADVQVVEEARSCLPDVEERRFTAVRPDRERVLGKRRFDPAAFGEGYRWNARIGDDEQVRVEVENPGHEDALFREGPEDEGYR